MQYLFKYILILIVLNFTSCGVYSFTGASIPEGAETIKIPLVSNKANIIVPSLSQTFTEKLQDRCANETSLNLTNNEQDLLLKGIITKYETRPISAAGTDIAESNEIVIAIEIEFLNSNTGDKWKQMFTQTSTYDRATNLKDVEDDLIEEISNLLIDAIFNRAFVNW